MDIYHQLLLNDARNRKDSVTCNADPEVLKKVDGIYSMLMNIGGIGSANGNGVPTTCDQGILSKITEISQKLSSLGDLGSNPNGTVASDTDLLAKIDALSTGLKKLEGESTLSSLSQKLDALSLSISSPDALIRKIDLSSDTIISALSNKNGDQYMESIRLDREQRDVLKELLSVDPKDIHTFLYVNTSKDLQGVDTDPGSKFTYKILREGRSPASEFSDRIKAHYFHLMKTATPFQNKGILHGVIGKNNVTETFASILFEGETGAQQNMNFNLILDPAIKLGMVTLGPGITLDTLEKNDQISVSLANKFAAKYPVLLFTYLYQYKRGGTYFIPKM